jgi:hypothetical protein
MARKRTLNRMDYRGDFEGEEGEAKPAGEEEEAEEEDEAEEEEEAEAEAEGDEEGSDEEEAPKPKKAKKKPAAPKRVRAPKIVRKRAVWKVFDNSSKEIETFEFSQRPEAEAFLEQKNLDKKGFYLQLVKVNFEDK